jgi:hypothetical protein
MQLVSEESDLRDRIGVSLMGVREKLQKDTQKRSESGICFEDSLCEDSAMSMPKDLMKTPKDKEPSIKIESKCLSC